MAQNNPTRTLAISNGWIRQVNRRFRRLKGDINRFILHSEITANQAFDFTSDPQSIASFLLFLQDRIDIDIFDGLDTPGTQVFDFWQNQYPSRAYGRGVTSAIASLRKQGINPLQAVSGLSPAQILGTATPSIGGVLIGSPIHFDAIQILYTRDFAALKNITDAMSGQIARILTDSVEQGLGARETARLINDRVDKIGITRARTLARTETVRAFNVGSINEGESLPTLPGTEVRYDWVDSNDGHVRPVHVARDNHVPFTRQVVMGLIGEPNCRCGVNPVLVNIKTGKSVFGKRRRLQRVAA